MIDDIEMIILIKEGDTNPLHNEIFLEDYGHMWLWPHVTIANQRLSSKLKELHDSLRSKSLEF